MTLTTKLRSLLDGVWLRLIAGIVMLTSAREDGFWLLGLAGVGLLISVGWTLYRRIAVRNPPETPWPWPPDLRSAAEALARPIDPTPQRMLPPDEKSAHIARVATTPEALSRLIAEQPPAWPWAVFTSVLLQRRAAVQGRLRTFAAGYQPRPGTPPISGREYVQTVGEAMAATVDVLDQIQRFTASPAFEGVFGKHYMNADNAAEADAEGIVQVANQLMDYHAALLAEAEKCVQTPVESDAYVFVHDVGAAFLTELVAFDQLISKLCASVGEAQDLLPYANGRDIQLDEVLVRPEVPDGLTERISAHIKRFNS